MPHPRDERDVVDAVSGQRRVPVLVDGDRVIVDSRRIVRHLYETYGGPAFARSAAELADDLDGVEEYDACAIGGARP
ncbi:MAG: glutathione S-transferase N-terminal domain-containing protein [Thermoleophilia bacterium]